MFPNGQKSGNDELKSAEEAARREVRFSKLAEPSYINHKAN